MNATLQRWIVRVLIGIVVFFNLDAAFSFMVYPKAYAPGFELYGVPGEAMIQGMGLLFLMWNVPYIIAILDPEKHFISLIASVIMQAIGVFGESILLIRLPGEHPLIKSSTLRFIVFDASGLILLGIALFIAWRVRKKSIVGKVDIKAD